MDRSDKSTTDDLLPGSILEASLLAIAVYEVVWRDGEMIDLKWRYHNKSMLALLGSENLIGKRLGEHLPFLLNTQLFEHYKHVVLTGETKDFEFEFGTDELPYLFRILAMKLGEGLVVLTEDLSTRRKAEIALREANEKIKLWQEITNFAEEIGQIGTWTYNLDNKQIEFSDNIFKVFNIPQKSVGDYPFKFMEAIHPEDKASAASLLEKINNRELTEITYRIFHPDGQLRHLRNKGRLYKNSKGENIYVGITTDVTDQKKDQLELLRVKEELLQQANEQFYALLNSIDDGFALLELVYNHKGEIDFKYLEINQSYSQITGIQNPLGKTIKSLIPSIHQETIEKFFQVSEQGQPYRYEYEDHSLARWYDVYVFKPGINNLNRIGIIISDITRRRKNEWLQKCLLELNNKIRHLGEASDIQHIAADFLLQKLESNYAFYSVITEHQDKEYYYLSNIACNITSQLNTGFYALNNHPTLSTYHKQGKKNVVHNVNGNKRLSQSEKNFLLDKGIHAWLSVPLTKNNRLVATLTIAQCTPRIWSDYDVSLTQEIAEITWAAAERAQAERALREAEERYLDKLKQEVRLRTNELLESKAILQSVFNSSPHTIGVYKVIRDADGMAEDIQAIMMNSESHPGSNSKAFDQSNYVSILKENFQRTFKKLLAVADHGHAVDFEEYFNDANEQVWLEFNIRKVNDLLVIHIQDVTTKKRNEEVILDIKLRQQKEVLNAIIHTQEQERQRIGEALHDGVAQLLYAIQIKLQTISPNEVPKPGLLKDINDIVAEAIKDTRRISFELVPAVLKDYGLEVALRSLFQRIIGDHLVLNFNMRGYNGRLPNQLEYALYRIVQEMVNNIIKHSKATLAWVEINQSLNRLMVKIRDNGKGFVEKKIDPMTSGIGLQSVRNRVKLLNGIMRVTSDNEGTRITIRLPLDQST